MDKPTRERGSGVSSPPERRSFHAANHMNKPAPSCAQCQRPTDPEGRHLENGTVACPPVPASKWSVIGLVDDGSLTLYVSGILRGHQPAVDTAATEHVEGYGDLSRVCLWVEAASADEAEEKARQDVANPEDEDLDEPHLVTDQATATACGCGAVHVLPDGYPAVCSAGHSTPCPGCTACERIDLPAWRQRYADLAIQRGENNDEPTAADRIALVRLDIASIGDLRERCQVEAVLAAWLEGQDLPSWNSMTPLMQATAFQLAKIRPYTSERN